MRKLFIFFLIPIELFVIVVLIYKMSGEKVPVNLINKNNINFDNKNEFKSFYEPRANSIEKTDPSIPLKATYTINFDTLNERYNYSVKKPKNTYRIITLGDSFTYGLYNNTEDNWPEQLEDLLNNKIKCIGINKFEVINLGMQGYDVQYEAYRFQQRGTKYNPDLALWFIKLNNFYQINEILLPKMKQFQDEMQKNGTLDKYIKQGQYYVLWNKALTATYNSLGETKILKLISGFIQRFDKKYKNNLILMTFSSTNKKYKQILIDASQKRRKTYVFDHITDTYKIDKYHFSTDWHPNQKGHKKIAEDVFNYLTKNKLIPCN